MVSTIVFRSIMILMLHLIVTIAFAQKQDGDDCMIVFNKSWYISGDTAWFNIFMPGKFQYENSIAQVRITNRKNGGLVTQYYVEIDHSGHSNGYFAIPHTINTGVYSTKIYLNQQQTKKKFQLIEHPLVIINSSATGDSGQISLTVPQMTYRMPGGITTQCEVNQKVYRPRDEVILDIGFQDNNGEPVVTTFALSALNVEQLVYSQVLYPFSWRQIIEPSFAVENNIIVKGAVFDQETSKPLNDTFLSIFLPKVGNVLEFNSGGSGDFTLQLPPFKNDFTMQFYDHFSRNFKVEIEESNEDSISLGYRYKILELEKFKHPLISSAKWQKVKFLFRSTSSAKESSQWPNWSFRPDYSIKLSDFQQFRSLEECVETLITPLRFRNSQGKIVAKMVNPRRKPFFQGSPVFLIDRRISSLDDVLLLDIKHYDKIDFYNTPETLQRFGHLGKDGVVAIHTLHAGIQRMDSNSVLIDGLQPKAQYPIQTDSNLAVRTPSMDPAVYWNPEIHTDKQGKAMVKFYHNDQIGEYRITISARSENGDMYHGFFNYKVAPHAEHQTQSK